jgi:hypothetical protein
MIKEFYPYYIAYDELKKALKTDFVDEPTADNTKPPVKRLGQYASGAGEWNG